MIEAKSILGSVNPSGDRIWTVWTRYPKMVHQEDLRHRLLYTLPGDLDFSWSVSSARAIPFVRMLEEVRSDELRATPVEWRKEQKGMSGGEEIDPIVTTRFWGDYSVLEHWAYAARSAADYAEDLHNAGIHKSICNRLLEPFLHVNVLRTGTTAAWMNFFGLRLDERADPIIRVLAEELWGHWNRVEWGPLQPGQWHLPYINFEEDVEPYSPEYFREIDPDGEALGVMRRVSAARCARLSYQSFATGRKSTIEEDLALYDRLVGSSPMHLSPLEHQATPDRHHIYPTEILGSPEAASHRLPTYENPHLSGNLGPGWIQYRKLLQGESVAPLPEKYQEGQW